MLRIDNIPTPTRIYADAGAAQAVADGFNNDPANDDGWTAEVRTSETGTAHVVLFDEDGYELGPLPS